MGHVERIGRHETAREGFGTVAVPRAGVEGETMGEDTSEEEVDVDYDYGSGRTLIAGIFVAGKKKVFSRACYKRIGSLAYEQSINRAI